MSKIIVIKNWKNYQHYKDRNPPWIKLHRELLTSETWVSLSDENRVLAIAIMLLAAATDNKIRADVRYVQRAAYLNRLPDFQPLIDIGFIDIIEQNSDIASNNLASDTECLTRAETEGEERRAEEEAEKNSPLTETSILKPKPPLPPKLSTDPSMPLKNRGVKTIPTIPPNPAAAIPPHPSAYSVVHKLSDSAHEKAKLLCKSLNRDFYNLAAIYDQGVTSGKRPPPKSADSAFPAWISAYTKNERL